MTKKQQSPQVFAKKLSIALVFVLVSIVALTITGQTQFMFLLGMIAPYLTIDHIIRNQAEDHPKPLTWGGLVRLVFCPSKVLDEIDEAFEKRDRERDFLKMKNAESLSGKSVSIVKSE